MDKNLKTRLNDHIYELSQNKVDKSRNKLLCSMCMNLWSTYTNTNNWYDTDTDTINYL